KRLTIALAARQLRALHAEDAAGRIDDADIVHRARLEYRVRSVAALVGGARQIELVARARAHPAVLRDDDGQRLVDHLALEGRTLGRLDLRAARIAVGLRVVADLAGNELLHRLLGAEQTLQALALILQLLQLGLDLDALEPRELSQPDLEDVLGLHVG